MFKIASGFLSLLGSALLISVIFLFFSTSGDFDAEDVSDLWTDAYETVSDNAEDIIEVIHDKLD